MKRKGARRTVLTLLLMLLVASKGQASGEDLEKVIENLEKTSKEWQGDRKQIARRLEAVQERLDKLNNLDNERATLREEAESRYKEALEASIKALPGAFRDTVTGKPSLGTIRRMIDMLINMFRGEKAAGRAVEIDIAELDGTTQRTIEKVSRQVADLKAQVAIYDIFISGVDQKLAEVAAQVSERRWQAVSNALAQLAQTAQQAKQQREERLRKEEQARSNRNGGGGDDRGGGPHGGGDRGEGPRGGGDRGGGGNQGGGGGRSGGRNESSGEGRIEIKDSRTGETRSSETFNDHIDVRGGTDGKDGGDDGGNDPPR